MSSLRRPLARLLPLLLSALVPLPSALAEEDRETALVDVLFFYAGADELKPARLTPTERSCLALYFQRGGRDSGEGPRGQPGDELTTQRRGYLQKQGRILSGDAAESTAFARVAKISVEWEGMSEDPLAEADQALEWLAENPATPLRPFVHLYSAYRYRAAFEAAHLERATRLYPVAAAGYKEQLMAAQESADPLVKCLADQMDQLPYLYMPGRGRP